MPRLASSSGGRLVTSPCPIRTRPVVIRRIPTSAFNRVLLPAPFGPITATISPGPTAIETSRITGTLPYPAVTPSALRLGAGRVSTSSCLSNKVRVHDLPLAPERRHGSASDQPSLRHHEDRVAELLDQVQLVLDHDDGQALAPQVPKVAADLGDDTWVHSRHRLVQQQAARAEHQCTHDLDHPLLATAHVPRVVRLLVAHAEPLQQLAGLPHRASLVLDPVALAEQRTEERVTTVVRRRHQEVFEHREPGEFAGQLEGPDQPAASAAVRGQPGDVLAIEEDRSLAGPKRPREHRQEGRLAGAIGTYEACDPTARNLQGHTIHGAHAVEMPVHIRRDQNRRGRGGHPSPLRTRTLAGTRAAPRGARPLAGTTGRR